MLYSRQPFICVCMYHNVVLHWCCFFSTNWSLPTGRKSQRKRRYTHNQLCIDYSLTSMKWCYAEFWLPVSGNKCAIYCKYKDNKCMSCAIFSRVVQEAAVPVWGVWAGLFQVSSALTILRTLFNVCFLNTSCQQFFLHTETSVVCYWCPTLGGSNSKLQIRILNIFSFEDFPSSPTTTQTVKLISA